jgi:putative endopeptidase
LENLLQLGAWQTAYEISRLGEKRVNQKDWDEPVFAVNAYYYTQSNEMVIPLGSLYWPFYSSTAPLGWNYGGLGCILAHESTHAFDKEGKEYDPDGFPKKWWTPSDNRAYNKKTKSLIQLFSSQKILDNAVSGSLTLSENIADLGGMAIALDALRKHLEQHKVSEEDCKKAYQQFFLSYAVSWRVKEKPEKTLQSLFLDHHAPPSLRVNLIVSQFDEWYKAFDILETDPMYIPPEKRIRIF